MHAAHSLLDVAAAMSQLACCLCCSIASVSALLCCAGLCPRRLQTYARDARKEYAELGSKDLSGLKSFVKGLPKLLLLDRLSDLAVPVAEVVKKQVCWQQLQPAVTSEPYTAQA